MVPGAFSYKQNNQPVAQTPSYPTGSLGATGVAAFRPATAATQGMNTPTPTASSASNPYAVKPAAQSAVQGILANTGSTPPSVQMKPASNQVQGNQGYTNNGQIAPMSAQSANNPSYYQNNPLQYGSWSGNPLFSEIGSIGRYLGPLAGQQAQFAGQMEPLRQQAIQNYLNMMSPASQQAQINTYGNQAAQNANVGAMQSNAMQKAMGLGTGYQAGNIAAAGQSAANARNQYAQQVASPQYQQQLLQGMLGAIGQGQQMPMIQELLGMNSGLMNQEQLNNASAGSGVLGGLAGIAGAYLGAGAPGLLKASSGGGRVISQPIAYDPSQATGQWTDVPAGNGLTPDQAYEFSQY